MFEIRNYEQNPVVVIRAATAQELATYEKWKQEKVKEQKEHKEKVRDAKI